MKRDLNSSLDSRQRHLQDAKWLRWLESLLKIYAERNQNREISSQLLQEYAKNRIDLELDFPNKQQFKTRAMQMLSQQQPSEIDTEQLPQTIMALEESLQQQLQQWKSQKQ
jgi:hypothetical protein